MIVEPLTEHHLRFLNLKGGCTGLAESTLVNMPHCWKSNVTACILFIFRRAIKHSKIPFAAHNRSVSQLTLSQNSKHS